MALESPQAPSIAPTIRSASSVNRGLTRQLRLPSTSPSPRRNGFLPGAISGRGGRGLMASLPNTGLVRDELSKQDHTSRRVRQLIALALTTAGVSCVTMYVASAVEHDMAKLKEKVESQKKEAATGRKLETARLKAKKRGGKRGVGGSNKRKSGDCSDLQREKKKRKVESGNEDWAGTSRVDLERKVDLLIQPLLAPSTSLSSTSSSSLSLSSSPKSSLSTLNSSNSAVHNAEIERDEHAVHLDCAATSCGNALQSMLRNLTIGIVKWWHSVYDEPFFEADDESNAGDEDEDEGEGKGNDDARSTGSNPFVTPCKTKGKPRLATPSEEERDRKEVSTLFASLNEIVDMVRRSIIQRGEILGVGSTTRTQKRKEEASHNAIVGMTIAGTGPLAARKNGGVDGSVGEDGSDDTGDDEDEDEQATKDKIVALQLEIAQKALMFIKTSDGFSDGVEEEIIWKCRAKSAKIVVDVNKYIMRMYGTEVSGGWEEVGMDDEENGICDQTEKMVLKEIQYAMDANLTLMQAALGDFDEERWESHSSDDGRNIVEWGGDRREEGLQPEALGRIDKTNRVDDWLEGVNQRGKPSAAESRAPRDHSAIGGTNAKLSVKPKGKVKSNCGRPRRRRTEAQKAALEKAKLASKASRLKRKQVEKEKEEARLARRAAAAAAAAEGAIPRKKGNTKSRRKGPSLKQRENLEKGRKALRTKRVLRAAAS